MTSAERNALIGVLGGNFRTRPLGKSCLIVMDLAGKHMPIGHSSKDLTGKDSDCLDSMSPLQIRPCKQFPIKVFPKPIYRLSSQ